MSRRIFVDMDGFLANLNKAFAPAFGLDYSKADSVLGYDWLMVTANITASEFFQIMETNCDLWDKVEPYPWTSHLVQLLDLKAPAWTILTAATMDPVCWRAKVEWLQRYLTREHVRRLAVIGGPKEFFASRGDILIDDRWHNVESWRKHGGVAFHWVDYHETLVPLVNEQIGRLEGFLDSHLGSSAAYSERVNHGKTVDVAV